LSGRAAYKRRSENFARLPRRSVGASRPAGGEREGIPPGRSALLRREELRPDRQPRRAAAARLLLLRRLPPARVPRPKLRAPYYELRFRNGYVTGIVATRRFNRFLSYGVNLDRFIQSKWYAVPHQMSSQLRRLAAGLRPLHLTRAALAKSR
jgi:hypothetical protein